MSRRDHKTQVATDPDVQASLIKEKKRIIQGLSTQETTLINSIKKKQVEIQILEELEKTKKTAVSLLDLEFSHLGEEYFRASLEFDLFDDFFKLFTEEEYIEHENRLNILSNSRDALKNSISNFREIEKTLKDEISSSQRNLQEIYKTIDESQEKEETLREKNEREEKKLEDNKAKLDDSLRRLEKLEKILENIQLFITKLTEQRPLVLTDLREQRKLLNYSDVMLQNIYEREEKLVMREQEVMQSSINVSLREEKVRDTISKINQIATKLGTKITI